MSIQVNAGANTVNWEALLGKIGDVQKTTSADGTQSLVLTMKVDDGTKTYTFGMPDDLELPQTIDETAINDLCDKLLAGRDTFDIPEEDIALIRQNLSEVLMATNGAVNTESKTVMFDLYKLMALLVEVAQKQRDAAREMRLAENAQVQHSIQQQADQQRTAAITGLIAGAICCGIQIVATGVALGQQAKAYAKQVGSIGESGLNSAKDAATMLKTANTSEAATKQLNSVKDEVGNNPSGAPGKTVSQAVNEGFQGSTDAGQQLLSAKSQLNETIEQRQVYEAIKANQADLKYADVENIPDAEAGGIKATLKTLDAHQKLLDQGISQENLDSYITAKKNFTTLSMKEKTQVMDFEARNPDVRSIGDKTTAELKSDLAAKLDAKVEQLRTSESNLKTEIETARVAYRDAIKSDIQRFENEYEIARHEVNNLPKDATPAESAAAKAKFTAAENKLKLARATGFDKLMKDGVTTQNEYFQDVRAATDNITIVDNARTNTTEYKDAQRTIDRTNTTLSVINMVGNATQAMITNINQWQQSEATRMGAEQEKAREDLDQTKDLFQQAQGLVDSVIQLMQAIRQAETQSMRDAIQA